MAGATCPSEQEVHVNRAGLGAGVPERWDRGENGHPSNWDFTRGGGGGEGYPALQMLAEKTESLENGIETRCHVTAANCCS